MGLCKSDIKDGLLKLILYCNLASLSVKRKKYTCLPVLKLTSSQLKGAINSGQKAKDITAFAQANALNSTQANLLKTLFAEAAKNKFIVLIQHAT